MVKHIPMKVLKGIAASIRQHVANLFRFFHGHDHTVGAKRGYFKGRRPRGEKK